MLDITIILCVFIPFMFSVVSHSTNMFVKHGDTYFRKYIFLEFNIYETFIQGGKVLITDFISNLFNSLGKDLSHCQLSLGWHRYAFKSSSDFNRAPVLCFYIIACLCIRHLGFDLETNYILATLKIQDFLPIMHTFTLLQKWVNDCGPSSGALDYITNDPNVCVIPFYQRTQKFKIKKIFLLNFEQSPSVL